MIEMENVVKLLNLFANYKGRVLGIVIGFIISLLIIRFGIILSIFIVICVAIGYYIGLRFDDKHDFRDIISGILPNNE